MKFKNLDRNILYLVGKDCCRRGNPGPLDLETIYTAFSDLPEGEVETELRGLSNHGFLTFIEGDRKISLTAKGVATVQSLPACRR